jgi:hypothetical protein
VKAPVDFYPAPTGAQSHGKRVDGSSQTTQRDLSLFQSADGPLG